ncbi:MAG: hypothetical protein HZA34_01035 [Candidatus Pacebacteria bacterium]|nr:hypothetical protein [Candidatus Paceibacterota bacterium]
MVRKQKKILVRVFACSLSLFFLFFALYLVKDVFIVRTIVCRYEDGDECPESVIAEFSRLKMKSMLKLSTEEHKKKILAGLSNLESVEEKKKYPSTLLITLHRSANAFVLFEKKNNEYILVNEAGKITQKIGERPEGIAILSIDQEYPVGSTLSETMVHAGRVLAQAEQFGPLKNGVISYKDAREILVVLPQNISIYLSSDEIEEQLSTLQFLLNEATMIEKATSIDLRFAHPVIR